MGHVAEPSSLTPNPHIWCHRRAGDSRAPCPALNAMANHGLLPRDGKDITLPSLICAVRDVYHLSWPLAIVLAVGGYILIKAWWRINLEDLALHNGVEHNASLAHDDAPSGLKPSFAPTVADPSLLNQLLNDSSDGKVMTAADIARARVRREATYEPGAIDPVHMEIARGEFALVLAIFGGNGAIPLDYLRTWMLEEKFPVGWVKPKQRVTLLRIILLSWEIRRAMEAMRQKAV
jgi:Peroxidase, family 2